MRCWLVALTLLVPAIGCGSPPPPPPEEPQPQADATPTGKAAAKAGRASVDTAGPDEVGGGKRLRPLPKP